MKRNIFFLLACFLLSLQTSAQNIQTRTSKPDLDTSVIDKWASLSVAKISPFGNYVAYSVNYTPDTRTFFVRSADGSWQRKFSGASNNIFSADEKLLAFVQKDSLHLLNLGVDKLIRSVQFSSYSFPRSNDGEWIAYVEKSDTKELVLVNLLNGKERRLGKVKDYLFDDNGKVLLIKEVIQSDSLPIATIFWLDTKTGNKTKIWSGKPGEDASGFKFDTAAHRATFMSRQKNGNKTYNAIWYYKVGMESAILKIRDGDDRIDPGFSITQTSEFSNNGRWFFLTIEKPSTIISQKPEPGSIMVDVWGYRDQFLHPDQIASGNTGSKIIRAVMSTEDEIFRKVEYDDVVMSPLTTTSEKVSGDIVIVQRPDTNSWADPRLNFLQTQQFYVLSLRDGTMKRFGQTNNYLSNGSFSPGGKWLVYFEANTANYFSCDLLSGRVHNITSKIPTKVTTHDSFGPGRQPVDEIAGWFKGDSSVLIYDNYDIWEVDLAGVRKPCNVTKGYGLIHQVKLRVIGQGFNENKKSVYTPGDTLLLTGFNMSNKFNGFLQQILGSKESPEVLFIGPYTFFKTTSQISHPNRWSIGMTPLKASNANWWIVKRQSAKDAPNYFLTADFKQFKAISDFAPQLKYNWLTSELVTYRQKDGSLGQGVLYKPENFDRSKKYPIIFNYYEELSHRLYEFPQPEYMTADINIPLLISQGYLVFIPDVTYLYSKNKHMPMGIGPSAFNSIVAAAEFLAKLPFIDGKHIGIQGHSMGGEETNYLITHTNLFAAASEMAGVTDQLSSYLTLTPSSRHLDENVARQYIKEIGQGRLNSTLWERPELYLTGSPILYANRITTPLLIVHNKNDGAVQWRQGVEMYMALRRLQKPSWMLQYDEGGHSVNGKEAVDYTIRLTQFFDHYLKGNPPPVWMTKGVPAKLKGIETRYAIDPDGDCAKGCSVCKKKDYAAYYQSLKSKDVTHQ